MEVDGEPCDDDCYDKKMSAEDDMMTAETRPSTSFSEARAESPFTLITGSHMTALNVDLEDEDRDDSTQVCITPSDIEPCVTEYIAELFESVMSALDEERMPEPDMCDSEEDDVFAELSSTTRKEEQMRCLQSLIQRPMQKLPNVGESGTLKSPKEQARETNELLATISTLKEKLREREQQKRDALGDLMEARKTAWEWKLDSQKAQARLREALQKNTELCDPASFQDDDDDFVRKPLPQSLDLAIHSPQKRRASTPAPSKVHDYLQLQEDQIRKLTSELCDARLVAVTYLKIIEERTEVIHHLEGEFAATRLKQLIAKHPAGEVISCDVSSTSNRDASLFTVQEDESQEKSFRLRPVPPPPLPERNVSPQSDDRLSFERQECSSVSSDERDREDRFEGDNERDGEPRIEEEVKIEKGRESDVEREGVVEAKIEKEETEKETEEVTADAQQREEQRECDIPRKTADAQQREEEGVGDIPNQTADAQQREEEGEGDIPNQTADAQRREEAPLLHLPPIEVPPLESNRFQTLAVRLERILSRSVEPQPSGSTTDLHRVFDVLKAIAGLHSAATYIQEQVRGFNARRTMDRLQLRRYSGTPSTLTDSSREPLGRPSRSVLRPASVPALPFDDVPSFDSGSNESAAYSYEYYTQYENRSVQTSLRDMPAARKAAEKSYTDAFFQASKKRSTYALVSNKRDPKPTLDPRKKNIACARNDAKGLRALPKTAPVKAIKMAWPGNEEREKAWPTDIAKVLSAMKGGDMQEFGGKTSKQKNQAVTYHHHHHYHVFVEDTGAKAQDQGSSLVYPLRPAR